MSTYQPTLLAPPADLKHVATLRLPWTAPPLSGNDAAPASKGAMYARAAKVREVRQTARLLGKRVRMPEGAGYLVVQLHYRPRDRRRRDTDNLWSVLKPLADGLVDAGLVADDVPGLMGKPEPIIWPAVRGGGSGLWFDLWCAESAPFPYSNLHK